MTHEGGSAVDNPHLQLMCVLYPSQKRRPTFKNRVADGVSLSGCPVLFLRSDTDGAAATYGGAELCRVNAGLSRYVRTLRCEFGASEFPLKLLNLRL